VDAYFAANALALLVATLRLLCGESSHVSLTARELDEIKGDAVGVERGLQSAITFLEKQPITTPREERLVDVFKATYACDLARLRLRRSNAALQRTVTALMQKHDTDPEVMD
jgi:hypothetical protein